MSRKAKREAKVKSKIISKILIVAIFLGLAFWILKIAPNYVNDDIVDKANIVINNSNVTADLKKDIIIENNVIYVSMEDITNFFDPYIYYDEKYNQIITTSENQVVSMVIGENKMTNNGTSINTFGTVIERNDTYYIPFSDLKDVYNVELSYIESSNTITVDSKDRKYVVADSTKENNVKAYPTVFSRNVDELETDEQITVVQDENGNNEVVDGWVEIRTDTGKLGYVKEDTIKNQVAVRETIEKEKQIELLEAAQEYIKNKKVNSIRISTRPDCIDKEILKRMKKYHVKTIELGVQSTNNYILTRCKRGHTGEDVKKASRLIRMHGFILGHQMMIGLPESTKQDEINTAKELIKMKPKIVRIYPVLVIKDTELADEYEKGEYIPLTVGQAVERCKEIVDLFNRNRINVIRIGLQNTEEISDPNTEKSSVIAGPYHPAFRQLVEDSMWYDSIAEKIKKINMKVKEVEITVNPESVNNVIGHKKENAKKLKEMYDVDIAVKPDENMKLGKFEINVVETY